MGHPSDIPCAEVESPTHHRSSISPKLQMNAPGLGGTSIHSPSSLTCSPGTSSCTMPGVAHRTWWLRLKPNRTRLACESLPCTPQRAAQRRHDHALPHAPRGALDTQREIAPPLRSQAPRVSLYGKAWVAIILTVASMVISPQSECAPAPSTPFPGSETCAGRSATPPSVMLYSKCT